MCVNLISSKNYDDKYPAIDLFSLGAVVDTCVTGDIVLIISDAHVRLIVVI